MTNASTPKKICWIRFWRLRRRSGLLDFLRDIHVHDTTGSGSPVKKLEARVFISG
jgi:hypothetical protein